MLRKQLLEIVHRLPLGEGIKPVAKSLLALMFRLVEVCVMVEVSWRANIEDVLFVDGQRGERVDLFTNHHRSAQATASSVFR